MSSFSIAGKLLKIYDTVQVTEKFAKREFVLEVISGQYSEQVKFQVIQDRCDLLDNFEEGQENVTVHFNLKGKAYTNKEGVTNYFTNLDCWKIESENAQKKEVKTKPTPKITITDDEKSLVSEYFEPPNLGDDLPF